MSEAFAELNWRVLLQLQLYPPSLTPRPSVPIRVVVPSVSANERTAHTHGHDRLRVQQTAAHVASSTHRACATTSNGYAHRRSLGLAWLGLAWLGLRLTVRCIRCRIRACFAHVCYSATPSCLRRCTASRVRPMRELSRAQRAADHSSVRPMDARQASRRHCCCKSTLHSSTHRRAPRATAASVRPSSCACTSARCTYPSSTCPHIGSASNPDACGPLP